MRHWTPIHEARWSMEFRRWIFKDECRGPTGLKGKMRWGQLGGGASVGPLRLTSRPTRCAATSWRMDPVPASVYCMTGRLGNVEPNTLGERKCFAVVDGVGGPPHIGFPGVRPGLTTATRFLFATERPADLRSGWADIYVGNPAIGALRRDEGLSFAHVIGKYGGSEA